MATFRTEIGGPAKRTSEELIKSGEAKVIMERLEAAPDDETLMPKLMAEYNCTKTTLITLFLKRRDGQF